MKEKNKLKKLVQIIGDLLKVEDNEWLIDEILKTIGETSPVEEITKHPLIAKIYEQCIEEVIDNQAKEFYKNFPIQEIKDQLIQDFKKMEHERRRNDFEGFGLCMFQQFESINNFLFKKYIESNWNKIKNTVVVTYIDKETNTRISKTLSEEVFGESNGWGVFPKFKSIIFYFYFNQRAPMPYSYKNLKEVFYQLYQIRNKNHREGDLFEFQKNILKKVEGNEAKYYFKFYGFLQDFVSQIELFYSALSSNKPIEKKTKNQQQFKNTLGAINPALEKLKQQKDESK
jgi:hypothetical protein